MVETVTLTLANLRLHNEATGDDEDTVWCMFGCEPCRNQWWRKVPFFKKVSTCQKCHQKYSAVDPRLEYGSGRFECPHFEIVPRKKGGNKKVFCRHVWTSKSSVDMSTQQHCDKCNTLTGPVKIGPPRNYVRPKVCILFLLLDFELFYLCEHSSHQDYPRASCIWCTIAFNKRCSLRRIVWCVQRCSLWRIVWCSDWSIIWRAKRCCVSPVCD
jgi:hypothetical protein